MTRAKLSRPPLPPRGGLGVRPARRVRRVALGTGPILAVLALAGLAGPGGSLLAGAHRFIELFAGVFCLVALSITVMIGLAATDRLVLMIRHRVLLQAVHRAAATAAMLFLGTHLVVKIVDGRAGVLDAVVPFLAGHRVVYIGLGTVASYLMILVTWTGVVRARFAGSAYPGLWRALHATTYPCWVVAIVHGLESGRSAKTWVVVSYLACLVLVGLGLLVRCFVAYSRRVEVAKAQVQGVAPAASWPRTSPPPASVTQLSTMDDTGTGRRRAALPVATAARPTLPELVPPGPAATRVPALGRPAEEVSDEEFWAFMRGEVVGER